MTAHNRLTLVAGVSLLSATLTFLPALGAHAAVHSTGALSESTVEAGSTVDLTVTPADSGGVADWCGAIGGDTDVTSSPGFSFGVILYSLPTYTNVWESPGFTIVGSLINYDSEGFGSFTPDTVSAPFTVTITIPSDVPAGDYLLGAGCMGPSHYGRGDSTQGIGGFITVTAAPDNNPDPTETTSAELPNTGLPHSAIGIATVAGTASFISGMMLLRRRRQRTR